MACILQTIETFLSKEVNYVISSSAPAHKSAGDADSPNPESPLFVNTPSPCNPEPNTADKKKVVSPNANHPAPDLAFFFFR
jgi:hypothetical protein